MAGLPAKTVRDMLRRLNLYSLMDALFVAARCKVSTRKAKEVIKTPNAHFVEQFEKITMLAPCWTPYSK